MAATAHAPRSLRLPVRGLRSATDEQLVARIRAGEEAAFEVVYDRHHRGILSFARHMLGSREEAEDAVQHAFIAAYRDLTASDKPIQLKAWLYAITRNRCLSVLRARREAKALDEIPEPATEGLSTEVQRRQDLRDLLGDLSRLPDDQRAALVLSELGALSHDEVAIGLGVRREKVKALVFQARESLAGARQARDADCSAVREELSVLTGGALRRAHLRRHLDVCAGCRDFREEVRRQRAAAAIFLPVLPTAGLKAGVFGALGGGGAAAAGAAATGAAGLGAGGGGGAGGAVAGNGAFALGGGAAAGGGSGSALATKLAVVVVAAAGATGAGLVAVDELRSDPLTGPPVVAPPNPENAVVQLRERAAAAERRRDRDRVAAAPGGAAAGDEAAQRAGQRAGDRTERRRTADGRVVAGAPGEGARNRAVSTAGDRPATDRPASGSGSGNYCEA